MYIVGPTFTMSLSTATLTVNSFQFARSDLVVLTTAEVWLVVVRGLPVHARGGLPYNLVFNYRIHTFGLESVL